MKTIYKYLLAAVVVLTAGQASAQSLETYLSVAAEENPGVQAAYARFEAALQRSPQVSALPDPTLTVGAFGRMMETNMGAEEAKFSLMQMFPWFGTLEAREEAANLMAEARFQEYLEARAQLFYEVKVAYAEFYRITKTIELQEENLEILDSYKELALSAFRSGNSPMVNVVKIDMERDAARTEVELLKQSLQPLRADFNLLLNRAPENELEVLDSLVFSSGEVLPLEEFDAHPSVQRFDKEREAYRTREIVAQKEGLPMLGLGVDYTIMSEIPGGHSEMNGRDMIMPMLSVSLPIFRKKVKAAREEANFMAIAMEQEQQKQKNELRTSYEMAKYELGRSEKLLALYERQIKSSEQANQLLISAFGDDTGGFEEVLEMNQSILLLRIQQLEALKNGFTAQARIEYLFSK